MYIYIYIYIHIICYITLYHIVFLKRRYHIGANDSGFILSERTALVALTVSTRNRALFEPNLPVPGHRFEHLAA